MNIGFSCVCTLSKNESDSSFFEQMGFYALDQLCVPAVVIDSDLKLIRTNRSFIDFFSIDVVPERFNFCTAVGCKNSCTGECIDGFKRIMRGFDGHPDRSSWINSGDGREKIRFINRISRFCGRENLYAVVLDQDAHSSLFDRRRMRMMQLAYAGKMTAFFAHEINNPLQVCYFGVDTLGRFLKKGQAQQVHIDRVSSGLGKISRIVRQMLAVNSGADEQKRNVDLNHIVVRVSQRLKEDFVIKQIELDFDFAKGLDSVETYDSKIFGVIEYLFLNAIAVSDYGQRICVATGSLPDRTFIQISDAGRAVKDRFLFDPEHSRLKGTNYGLRLFAAEGLSDIAGAVLEVLPSDSGNVYRLVFNTMVDDEV